jgi:hypothetical protein
MEPTSLPRLLIGYGILFGLPLSLFLFPRSRWSRQLTAVVGPALDARLLTRRQCLWNAATYALLGSAAIAAALLTSLGADWWFAPAEPPLPFFALGFAYFLMGLVGLGGALYLLMAAPSRPAALEYAPPSLDIRILKPYLSFDRSYTAYLGVTPDDHYYVLVPKRHLANNTTTAPVAIGPFEALEQAERRALTETGHLPDDGV